MRGYRANQFSQIETLVFMALYERAHAVFARNLEAKITDPALKGLVGRIASDEERHEAFFANLVAHCLQTHRDSTINSINRRAVGFGVVGGDILEYQDNKLRNVAQAGIFDLDASAQVVSDRIIAWGLGDEPVLKKFVRS
jgi:acyl-[acyl-carrier-protein] desaturase